MRLGVQKRNITAISVCFGAIAPILVSISVTNGENMIYQQCSVGISDFLKQ